MKSEIKWYKAQITTKARIVHTFGFSAYPDQNLFNAIVDQNPTFINFGEVPYTVEGMTEEESTEYEMYLKNRRKGQPVPDFLKVKFLD